VHSFIQNLRLQTPVDLEKQEDQDWHFSLILVYELVLIFQLVPINLI
jgi:hypothetical protein